MGEDRKMTHFGRPNLISPTFYFGGSLEQEENAADFRIFTWKTGRARQKQTLFKNKDTETFTFNGD